MTQEYTNAEIYHVNDEGEKVTVGQVTEILKVPSNLELKRFGEAHTDPQEVANVALQVTSQTNWSTSKTTDPHYHKNAFLEGVSKTVEPQVRATTDGDFITVGLNVFEVVDGAAVLQPADTYVNEFANVVVKGPKVLQTGGAEG